MRLWFGHKREKFFADVCEKYRDYAFQVALRITRNRTYAEDVVQETMCKMIRLSASLQNKTEEELKKYLIKSVVNNSFTYMSKVLREQPMEYIYDDVAVDCVMEKILQAETKEQLEVAMRRLTEKQRLVLVLMFYETWSTEEIAAELNITADGVRMLKKRGLDNMRGILLQEGWDGK